MKKFAGVVLPLDDNGRCEALAAELLKALKPAWFDGGGGDGRIAVEFFTDGITNKIFCCGVAGGDVRDRVVFRVYGRNTELVVDRRAELLNWQTLSEHDCAAALHATFDNGIVCAFQPGRTLTADCVFKPEIWNLVAAAMAKVHKVPLREDMKASSWLFSCLRKFFAAYPSTFADAGKQERFSNFATKADLLTETALIERKLRSLDMPIVFCHNDLLLGNILFDEATDRCSFIDYEYAGANYQAYDVGNHFCEYAGLEADFTRYPAEHVQKSWIEAYLGAFLDRAPSTEEIQLLFVQANVCATVAHFFWSVWSVIQASNSTIDFDYLSYGELRYAEYLRMKDWCFSW